MSPTIAIIVVTESQDFGLMGGVHALQDAEFAATEGTVSRRQAGRDVSARFCGAEMAGVGGGGGRWGEVGGGGGRWGEVGGRLGGGGGMMDT